MAIFWTEKIKLTQYIIQTTKNFSSKQLDFSVTPRESVRFFLQSMVAGDFFLRVSLPISVGISSILPIARQSEEEIEKDLVRLRDQLGSPALPIGIKEIITQSADELFFEDCNPELKPLFIRWKKILIRLEKTIQGLSTKDSLKYRYFSVIGIVSLPVAINYFEMQNLTWLRNGIMKIAENPNFPSQ
ncbi:hypothetical protein LEP1GSC079_0975 [Leptospira interrogans str. FPW1039]|uniref:Uncharacterized protein n=1 Tax=Leptospira interrogans str. FPW1039 TaxID=1193040 RepID=A0A0F6IFP3_LEPIR|nr:hypothetical protein LEP1GSC069_4036 [Leptospira interrogans serovar Canicola str. Fiocruz LV133]EKR36953.1 hypothetical protein LEP1GSC096_4393 [Leptospira interrogans serovar Hebdomadis str. R499]EMF32439.1 hypothetical protein LEP1GSC201_4174 [Leptospira interrogans serovar Pomona str. Fox 32256]EMJ36868.1 hypothetical protein LEP1GSC079_0975 [Leptospira interrogans str. FPW1039]EMJ61875.1 hypothetical protein LEP1GSC197_3888 [Leptospira interrogans serovar Pomona str. CSL4002]EMK16592.1